MSTFLFNAVVLLTAAVLLVPLARRWGLGAVIGYLVAGVVVGPWGVGLITQGDEILHFAEFGVVLLLFLIGLELNPRRLWALRHTIFGLGLAQVLISGGVLGLGAWALGLEFTAALVVGFALSLSSTAFALQLIEEQGLTATQSGQTAFSILLFQDLAVVPLLALVPLLGSGAAAAADAGPFLGFLKAVCVIVGVVYLGPLLARPLFRYIALTGMREMFTVAALFVVVGVSTLFAQVGLSMELGAFIAGVLMAESEYRHELEIDIEPFKGLLMGLFFVAVGLALDVGLLRERPLDILALAAGLITVKFAIVLVLSKLFGVTAHQTWRLSAFLCQGGEFAFVLFGVAVAAGVFGSELARLLTVTVVATMVATPLVLRAAVQVERWRFGGVAPRAEDVIDTGGRPVIIAGFGRYGQIIDRLLHANRIATTVIDHDPDQIDLLRRYGHTVFYGDATRLDLLRAAGAEEARLMIIALDDQVATNRLVDLVRENFPALPLLVRVRNRTHAYEMLDRGIVDFERETFAAALNTGVSALKKLGFGPRRASDAARLFHQHDESTLRLLQPVHRDQEKYTSMVMQARADLDQLMNAEAASVAEGLAEAPTEHAEP